MRRRAFTLLELVLVLALLVIVGVIAFPSLDAMYGSFRVRGAADAVRAAWAQGRAHAVNEGRAYRFSVVPDQGNYRLAPDSPEYWTGNNVPSPGSDPANAPLVIEATLPKGVRFSLLSNGQQGAADSNGGSDTAMPSSGVDPSMWSSTVTFLPDGTAREDVGLIFQAPGARPLIMRLRGLTGVVTTQPWQAGEQQR